MPISGVSEKPLANPAALAYYSPPRNTTRRCKAALTTVAGLAGRLAQQGLQRRRQQKRFLRTVDETKKALHNLVSLLQTTQRAERQSRVARFFNKQTTDKCGRWVADATVYGQ